MWLVQVWPEITLHIVPDAGHSSREPGIAKLLVEVSTSSLFLRPFCYIFPVCRLQTSLRICEHSSR